MHHHCVKGVRHEGTTEGIFDTIGGIKCYLSHPIGNYSREKAILFLPDAFGIELENNQLLCDDFARNGFQVVGVDLFNGDPVPVNAMDMETFDFTAWLPKHGTTVTGPRIDNAIAALKEQGIKEFAVTGYCFSARYVFDLAFDKIIEVAAVSHPSLLNIPEDLHKFKETGIPLLINSCEIDLVFPVEAQAQADAILGGNLTKTDLYRREYFEGCTHGFAVRGDVSNPKVKAWQGGRIQGDRRVFLGTFLNRGGST